MIVSSLEELLTYKGYDVVGTGHDGNEAVSLYKELIPNVVLLDVKMPNKNGFEALEEIKKINENANVIMITGEQDLATEIKLQELGAITIIQKPFEIERIIEIIKKIQNSEKILFNGFV